MTKAAYLEYYRQWVARTYPDLSITVTDEFIRTEGRGGTRTGFPMECDCGAEDCLGWVMGQVHEIPAASQSHPDTNGQSE